MKHGRQAGKGILHDRTKVVYEKGGLAYIYLIYGWREKISKMMIWRLPKG